MPLVDEAPIARPKALRKRTYPAQYFTKNGRLYFILEYDTVGAEYYIENCETLFRMWVSDRYMREEVHWVARNSNYLSTAA